MDRVKVDEPREAPPSWAKPDAGSAEAVAAEALAGEPKITPRQREFLLSLIAERVVKPEQEGKVDLIMKCLRISEDPTEYGMSKSKASELITWFLRQDKKPKPEQQPEPTEHLSLLPAGRYAIENEQGELRFYQCWESRDKKAKRLYVIHGPYESRLPFPAQKAIARKIMLAGVRKCAIRYGMEIGSCSNCGRRLTNRISRELGIGPVCGGRMFGDDDWKTEVKTARAAIVARGEDPNEELTD